MMMKLFDGDFWTAKRRTWLYSVVTALVPLLLAVGVMTGEIAEMVLRVAAAVLAVSATGMALSNITPDTVLSVGLDVTDESK
jgi:hypothetical protein